MSYFFCPLVFSERPLFVFVHYWIFHFEILIFKFSERGWILIFNFVLVLKERGKFKEFYILLKCISLTKSYFLSNKWVEKNIILRKYFTIFCLFYSLLHLLTPVQSTHYILHLQLSNIYFSLDCFWTIITY